jgi:hypothetical protein
VSLPLVDVRSAVDGLTDALLEATSQARGVTKSETIRDILTQWSRDQLKIHRKIQIDLQKLGLNEYGEPAK